MSHIGEHLGAGFLADAPFSGKCAGHRCFRNTQRLRHLLDSHFFRFLLRPLGEPSPLHCIAQQISYQHNGIFFRCQCPKATKSVLLFSRRSNRPILSKNTVHVLPNCSPVAVKHSVPHRGRLFRAVLHKHKAAAPRRQDSFRQSLRPSRTQADFLCSIVIKRPIKSLVKAAGEIVSAALTVSVDRRSRVPGKIVLVIQAERLCRIFLIKGRHLTQWMPVPLAVCSQLPTCSGGFPRHTCRQSRCGAAPTVRSDRRACPPGGRDHSHRRHQTSR